MDANSSSAVRSRILRSCCGNVRQHTACLYSSPFIRTLAPRQRWQQLTKTPVSTWTSTPNR
jgi:hypothetical protein